MKRVAWLCGFACFAAAGARGDEILIASRARYSTVRIEDVRDGVLHFRDVQGRVLNRPLADVERLMIAGWESFNRAEQSLAEKRYRPAVREYEALLDSVEKGGAANVLPRHRRELLMARLVCALDGEGEFDHAVGRWVELCGLWGEAAAPFAPRNVPGRQSALHAAAVAALQAAVERGGNSPGAKAMRDYLERLQADPAKAPPVATKPVVASAPVDTDERLRQMAKLVEAGRFDTAMKMIEHHLASAPADKLASLYYWRGRCGEAAAKDDAGRLRAAMDYMRVPIHFPADAQAAECLYRTAVIHKQAGHADRVEPLLREALGRSPSDELKKQIEALLARRTGAGS